MTENLAEIWMPVKGYETKYLVSNLGRVKQISSDKILKNSNRGGYLRVTLIGEGIRKQFTLSRLVAQSFIPNPYNKKEVNHIDGNKLNNKVSNLEWVTPKENIAHAWENGLLRPRKMSSNHIQKLKDANCRKVINLTTNTVYNSVTDAANAEGYKKSTLIHYLLGTRKNKTNMKYL